MLRLTPMRKAGPVLIGQACPRRVSARECPTSLPRWHHPLGDLVQEIFCTKHRRIDGSYELYAVQSSGNQSIFLTSKKSILTVFDLV